MATVLAFVRRSDGIALTRNRVLFRPASDTPKVRTGAVVPTDEVAVVTNGAGFFSVTLFGGVYKVWIGNSKRPVEITVPDDDTVNVLEDLMATSLSVTKGAATPVNYLLQSLYTLILDADEGSFRAVRCTGDASSPAVSIDEAGVVSGPVNARWNSTSWELWNDDAGAWFAPFLSGDAKAPEINFGDSGVAIPGNARLNNRKLQILNTDTTTWHTVFTSAASLTFSASDPT
jgi:hypothetical protein